MGTNYYLYQKPPCHACGHQDAPLHIGKSSAGWCFSLHVDTDLGIADLKDWARLWTADGAYIEDEYGERFTPDKMLIVITDRARPTPTHSVDYDSNYACPGPHNLIRHKISGLTGCIGHGQGTWDLITGEFT